MTLQLLFLKKKMRDSYFYKKVTFSDSVMYWDYFFHNLNMQ